MIQVLGYIFAVGMISLICSGLAGFIVFGLMAAEFIEFNPPPTWLWIWLLASVWVAFAGGVPYALLSK